MKENFIYYYFPDECPGYKDKSIENEETVLLYDNINNKYYLPEKNSLIKIHVDNFNIVGSLGITHNVHRKIENSQRDQ